VLEILEVNTGAKTKLPIPNSAPDIYDVVSPDDKTAYVLGQQLCAVDIASATVATCGPRITLAYTGLLRALALDSTGTRIFAIGASTVGEYDTASLNLLQTASLSSGESAVGITYSSATNSVYVIATDTTNDSGTVTRIDATSFTVAAIAVTPSLLSDIAVSPDGKQVYLAAYTNEIQILDGTTLATTGSVSQIRASSVVTTPQ
jgi:DNA-binding beta-propeller fold protein YncE